jgi:hypothetical protein
MGLWEGVLARLRNLLRERYAIDHVTLQPESRHPAVRLVRHERRRAPSAPGGMFNHPATASY